jgi:hypothetical protein
MYRGVNRRIICLLFGNTIHRTVVVAVVIVCAYGIQS